MRFRRKPKQFNWLRYVMILRAMQRHKIQQDVKEIWRKNLLRVFEKYESKT